MSNRSFARTFGQDLMRGEHVVGGGGPVTSAVQVRPGGGGNEAGRAFSDRYNGGDAWAGRKSMAAGHTFGEIENYGGADRTITGTSIFDPVLCEVAYRWFCPPGGLVLDPFAGGSVRGIVASKLGRHYVGIDLRPEQVEANVAQAKRLCKGKAEPEPHWDVGDSRAILPLCPVSNLIF